MKKKKIHNYRILFYNTTVKLTLIFSIQYIVYFMIYFNNSLY